MADSDSSVNVAESGVVKTDWKSLAAIVVACVWLYSQYEKINHKLDIHNGDIASTTEKLSLFYEKWESIEARLASLEIEVARFSGLGPKNSLTNISHITANSRESLLLQIRKEALPYLTTTQIAEVRDCSTRWILANIEEDEKTGTFFYKDEFGFSWKAKKDGKSWLIENPFLIN